MATMTVWKFPTPEGADQTESQLKAMQKEGLIEIQDAATVSFPPDAKKPKTRQLHSLTGPAAMGGAFWGFLLGLIFFVPLLGAAIGVGLGALSGSLVDVGIDDDFIKRTRSEVTPGTSALFLLSTNAVVDKIRDRFASTPMTLIETNLSNDQEDKLREVFAA